MSAIGQTQAEQATAGRAPPKTLVYLQVLRFVAATAVVAFHAVGTGGTYFKGETAGVFSPFRFGDHGVDLFFVISGFIICYSTSQSSMGGRQFLMRRLERIVPIYWIMTLAMVALAVLVPGAFSATNWINPLSVAASLSFTSFLMGSMPIVYVGWSLEYEMLFYIVAALLLSSGERSWDRLVILFSALVALGVAAKGAAAHSVVAFLTNPLLLEFAFGVVVAKLFMGREIAKTAFVFVTLAALSLAITDPSNRGILFGAPAALVVFAAARLSQTRVTTTATERAFSYLGDASYSIYLVHIFIVSGTMKIASRLGGLSLETAILITIVASLLAGCALYALVERPVLIALRSARRSGNALRLPEPNSGSALAGDTTAARGP